MKTIKIRCYGDLRLDKLKGWNLSDEKDKKKKIFDLVDDENRVCISIEISKKSVNVKVFNESDSDGLGNEIFSKKVRYKL